jgi:hypothetical protein
VVGGSDGKADDAGGDSRDHGDDEEEKKEEENDVVDTKLIRENTAKMRISERMVKCCKSGEGSPADCKAAAKKNR